MKYVPKGASRRKSSKKESPGENEEDTNLSNDKSIQCDLLEAPEDKEIAETGTQKPEMCDKSCQTECDMPDNCDEEPAEDEPENLYEGNPDAKFNPLILKHQGVFTNLQGMGR